MPVFPSVKALSRDHNEVVLLSFHMPIQEVRSLEWLFTAFDLALESWMGIVVCFVSSVGGLLSVQA